MSLPTELAIVDLETTGANPVLDRVTEIAILRVSGGVLLDRWSALVNPGVPIPPTIQRFTGITDAMVRDAPAFAELAAQIRARLSERVFVAHNARFDYGFLRNEFERAGEAFSAPVLCTVKLSRALHPQHHRHGLDALIERHGLSCSARHRALGDAEALWAFLALCRTEFPAQTLDDAVARAMKRPSRPARLPEGVIEGIPPSPGVYLFFGERHSAAAVPLYVGKSVNLRSRVAEHFSAVHRNGREAELAQQVCHVEFVQTAGELGALLLESRLVKSRRPLYNRALRDADTARALRLRPNRRKPPVIERVAIAGADPAAWDEELYGVFRGTREIDNALRELALLYRLCPQRLGIEPPGGACLAHQMRQCAGVCAGKERPAAHDARLAEALRGLRAKRWEWSGPIGVREFDEAAQASELHVLDHWCHLGTVRDDDELAELLASAPPRAFDLDVYRILTRWLDSPAHRQRIVPLPAR